MNCVIICGRLGQDPELKHLPTGSAVANFSVATSENFVDKNGVKNERVEWHKIVVFGKTAENASKFLLKGREVLVQGKLRTRTWDDDKGQKRYATEVLANSVQFIGSNGEKNGANQASQSNVTSDNNFNQQMDNAMPEFNSKFTADDILF